jgi:hypothetical protein
MDSEEKLAWDSDLVCLVLIGSNERGEMVTHLVNADEADVVPPECWTIVHQHNCRYMGILGIKDGLVEAAPADANPATFRALTAVDVTEAFIRYATGKLTEKRKPVKSDGVDWLKKLMSLPDDRVN